MNEIEKKLMALWVGAGFEPAAFSLEMSIREFVLLVYAGRPTPSTQAALASTPAQAAERVRAKRKCSDVVRVAVATGDAVTAGQVQEVLRIAGLTYQQVLEFAQKHAPGLTAERWESLMQESEEADQGLVASAARYDECRAGEPEL